MHDPDDLARQLAASESELARYRQAEQAVREKQRHEALKRAERRRVRMLAIPLASSIITPILITILLVLEMCGCAPRTSHVSALPPTTMTITVGQLIKGDSSFCSVWKVDEDLVATAGHCCTPGATYEIDNAAIVEGTDIDVLVDDDVADICILRAYMIGPPLELAPRDPPIGAIVMTAGFPRGYYLRSMGLWSGRASWTDNGVRKAAVVSSTYSQPGASGSPLLDDQGRVVGLVSACALEPDKHTLEGVNIAAPVEKIRAAIRAARKAHS